MYQHFEMNSSDLYELMLAIDNCKYSKYLSASGEIFFLSNKVDSDLKQDGEIEVEASRNHSIHQFGVMEITLKRSNSTFKLLRDEIPFTKDCKTVSDHRERFSYNEYKIIAFLFAIPLLGLLIHKMVEIRILYVNRTRVYPFTP